MLLQCLHSFNVALECRLTINDNLIRQSATCFIQQVRLKLLRILHCIRENIRGPCFIRVWALKLTDEWQAYARWQEVQYFIQY